MSDSPLDQTAAPYLEAIAAHLGEDVLSFHVPGHQGGKSAEPTLHRLLGDQVFRADLTEVLGIDNLHRPCAQLLQAQRLAAAAFGAEETHFLVNGSTSGNHAMLLAGTRPDQLVLVPRNAHRSIWGGLMLSGASAAVYEPPFDQRLGVYTVATPECLNRAADRHPQATAFVLSSPGYHGHAADTVRVVEAAHRRGLMVLADEAWGAHLAFHPGFPTSAVSAGADLTVQSTHKMLPALTQGAMLHVRGPRVSREHLAQVLGTLLSSSPSAPLLVALDSARRRFALQGEPLLEEVARLAAWGQREIGNLRGIVCHSGGLVPRGQVSLWDPARLVVSALGRGYTGYEVETWLRYQHRLQIEMADPYGVVVVLTAGHREEDLAGLCQALSALPPKSGIELAAPAPPPFPETVLTPRHALGMPSEPVAYSKSEGRRSAETVTLYPPGIPWLLPGQRIERATLTQLKERREAGGMVQGASDPTLRTLRVLRTRGSSGVT